MQGCSKARVSAPSAVPLVLVAAVILSAVGVLAGDLDDGAAANPLSYRHEPLYSLPAGTAAAVSVRVEQPELIEEGRLYFKTMATSWHLYRLMTRGKDTLAASLPPPRKGSAGLDYRFVFAMTSGEIVKSKAYRVLVRDGARKPSAAADDDPATTYTERTPAPESLGDYHFPLAPAVSPRPLLARAVDYRYPPGTVRGPGSTGSRQLLGGTGVSSFSLDIGGVSIKMGAGGGL